LVYIFLIKLLIGVKVKRPAEGRDVFISIYLIDLSIEHTSPVFHL